MPTGVEYETAAWHWLVCVLATIEEGQEIDGGMGSFTVTVARQVSLPPAGPTFSATDVEGKDAQVSVVGETVG